MPAIMLLVLGLLGGCGGGVEPRTGPDTSDTDTSETDVPTGDTGQELPTGDTGPEPTSTPTAVTGHTGTTGDTAAPSTAWTLVKAGRSASCGLDQDGEARCLHDGPFAIPAPPPGPFVDLAVAFGTACAIDTTGAIQCWGCDFVDDMCQPPTGNDFVKIEAEESSVCALRSDGSAECWGVVYGGPGRGPWSDFDPAVTGFTGLSTTGQVVGSGEAPGLPGSGYTELGAGRSFVCALDGAGDTVCSQFSPSAIPTTGLTQLDGMSDTFCWIDDTDHVGCWPADRNPSAARDGFDPATTSFVSVSAGHHHACGVTTSGEGWCWPAGDVFTTWPTRP